MNFQLNVQVINSGQKIVHILFICIIIMGRASGNVNEISIKPDSSGNVMITKKAESDVIESGEIGNGVIKGTGERALLFLSGEMDFVEKPDEILPLAREIDYPMLWKVGLIVGAGWTGLHFYKQNAWWKEDATNFHIYYDWDYAIWLDKIGHFYGTNILAHTFRSAFAACNFEQEQVVWYGSAMALAFQTYVEIEDGFSPQWGFSPPDMYANILGAVYPVLQYYEPFLYNFQFKFSYYPKWALSPHPADGRKRILIDDYEGQKYWLSMNMKNILPEFIGKYWFPWLNIAVGVGGTNINGWGGGKKDVFISLDLNTDELPIYGSFETFIKKSFSFIKLPMPGIRITDKVVFFGLCY